VKTNLGLFIENKINILFSLLSSSMHATSVHITCVNPCI